MPLSDNGPITASLSLALSPSFSLSLSLSRPLSLSLSRSLAPFLSLSLSLSPPPPPPPPLSPSSGELSEATVTLNSAFTAKGAIVFVKCEDKCRISKEPGCVIFGVGNSFGSRVRWGLLYGWVYFSCDPRSEKRVTKSGPFGLLSELLIPTDRAIKGV